MQAHMHRTNPHGHTAETARPEPRYRVAVEVRSTQMSQMLPDGRAYGPGRHVVQVYQSELPALLKLVEPSPEAIDAARNRHVKALRKFIEETGQPEGAYPGSVEREFRFLEDRDVLPLVSVTDIEELESIADEEERRRARMTMETANAGASVSSGLSLDDIKRLVTEGIAEATGPAIAKAIAAERERVAATAKAGK